MKTSLLLFVLYTFGFGQDPIDKLIGKWKLEKVEVKGKTISPQKETFYVNIGKTDIGYNDGCNGCSRQIISINDTSIKLSAPGCTKKLCTGMDAIAKYIDYSGTYELHDSILIITNTKGKEYLKRK